MTTDIERKLTTILAADVEGYSRLMETDEVDAMATLKDSRGVFARLIERHRGRIANTAGDGLIADFPSVVEAVRCAAEVQTELDARNRGRDPHRAMRFRIGVHVGDVMVDGGDLFGEGVNMAARLQTMAEPGGVLISQAVYDQVRTKLSIGYEYLGEREAKNLAGPVPVYRLILDGPPASDTGRGQATDARAADVPPADGAAPHRPEAGSAVAASDSRLRLVRRAQTLGLVWLALAAVNPSTSERFWAVWPGIAFATVLGLEAAPLAARGWVDVLLVRWAVVTAALAMVNLASWSGEPWFLWPAGALLVFALLRRTWRHPA
jgi:adenylate cyclase